MPRRTRAGRSRRPSTSSTRWAPRCPAPASPLAVNANAAIASLDGDISLALPLGAGSHTILVEAQDDLGNWGASASIPLVLDLAGPTTTSVAVSPNPNNGTLGQDGYPGVVWVSATVTDSGPLQSRLKSAEGFIDPVGTPANGSGWQMMAVDGTFDQPVEAVYAQIPLSEIVKLSDGSHVFAVRGLDVAGNWGALATGTLQIDKTGPGHHGRGPERLDAFTAPARFSSAPRPPTARWSTASSTSSTAGTATSVNVAAAATASISNRPITITNATTGTLHYVYVRAHDAAGNWGAWSQLPLTVTNPLSPVRRAGARRSDHGRHSASR